MAVSKKPYKGTRDFFPKEKREQDHLFQKMNITAQVFGYEHYDGPLLEELNLYKAKSGEELINEQVYSFNDRGNREVAIRPEMTPTVARMVSQVHREVPKPIRWYSIPNLMRYERPQKGRLREHWQFNVDIFGSPKEEGELEILAIAVSLLQSFGATEDHFEILLNNRIVVDYFFNNYLKLDEEQSYKLIKLVDRYKKLPEDAFTKKLLALNLSEDQNEVIRKYLNIETTQDYLDFLEKISFDKEFWDPELFLKKLDLYEIKDFVKLDPSIVRGLDYYTGIVFEIFDKNPENRRAICGGGAYANLLKIFGESPLSGVGFGLGDVTLTDFLKAHKLMPDFNKASNHIAVTYQSDDAQEIAIKLSQKLRRKNLKTISYLEPLKFKKAFNFASNHGANSIALIGNNEVNNNKVTIKNLKSGEQKEFDLSQTEDIENFILS